MKWRKILTGILSFCMVFVIISCKKDSAPSDAPEIVTKISGTVTNKLTGISISGAQVSTTPATSTISSDQSGKFEFTKIQPGSYIVKASKSGFNEATVTLNVIEGTTANADIQLSELGPQLEVLPTFVNFGTTNNQTTISINNSTGIGTVNFVLTKNASWLSLSETAGSVTTVAKQITLTVDRASVGYGTYDDVITLTSNVGNLAINVQMVKRNPDAPQLTVSPIILDFGTTKNSLSVALSNTGTGNITWNATSSVGWASVSPSSGSLNSTSTTAYISVNRTGIPPNTLNGTVLFSSNGGNQTVGIKMTVPSVPVIGVTPDSVYFSSTETTKNLYVSNLGSGELSWSVVSSVPWLSISPTEGTNYTPIALSVSRIGLITGLYEGVLTFTSNGGTIQRSIKMSVPEPAPPSPVTLYAPYNINGHSCSLSWQPSSLGSSEFSSYKVYYSTSPNVNENSTLYTSINDISTTSCQISDLSSSSTYYFKVYVVNNKGVSVGSNIVNCTTTKVIGSWSVAITLTGVNNTNNCLFPLSESDVWVVGDDIWHYNGSTWSKATKPSGVGKLYSVYFFNWNDGWAVGANGAVIRYNGSYWYKVTTSVISTTNTFFAIVGSSSNDVWTAGSNSFYHFDGSDWVKITVNSGYINDMDMLNKNEIWANTNNGFFKYNGNGWALVYSVVGGGAISAVNSNCVWASKSSTLYKFDGTEFKSSNISASIYTLFMFSENDGWAGSYGKFFHYDGSSWKQVTSPTSANIESIRMTSSRTGWAVSSGGEILRYKE